MNSSKPPESVRLESGKRVLFLTKDLELLRKQLYHGLDLQMSDLTVDDLLDDINTDVMTPAWVCFDHLPTEIAKNAYAGLLDEGGKRVFVEQALMNGGFEAIVSGYRKGTGSSRETAAQCERWSGIRYVFAASFAPIHERNNINLGQLMGDHAMLERLQSGEAIELSEFIHHYDPVTQIIIKEGGLFAFSRKVQSGEINLPANATSARGMTMAEKMIAAKMLNPGADGRFVAADDAVLAKVDAGFSHEFTTAQVHTFLLEEYGKDYAVINRDKLAVFEDHLLYADGVARFQPFVGKIQTMRDLQREFQVHTGVRDYQAVDGVSPGICHQIAREVFIEPGDFVQATDSHTCMGGGSNALTYGVGATEYAALAQSGFTFVRVPETIRFDLVGELQVGVCAKDVILHILNTFAKREDTLNRSMEFGGSGLSTLSVDERATLCNMATECTARTGICEGDMALAEWLAERRSGQTAEQIAATFIAPDPDAHYTGGVHEIDLSQIVPMVAEPGDPTYGKDIADLAEVKIDIAYGGSCTAGKADDMALYAQVCQEALDAGRSIPEGTQFFIQYGSKPVQDQAIVMGWDALFRKVGVQIVDPGCGACIGCGPGVSDSADQVTVSAINRNFAGRSGPGSLYLASPLTVAASAFAGRVVAYEPASQVA
ncbi:MAG: aconitate hydratase [Planctomycetes bacterium]|jgi:3-isopropylmalate/(R)-2-methylmalate dehydratase large subunit|nr:aconitate hydratase [Planctomycetota bacterium]MBT4027920.1 aconitate hydratase [Planctomycetota bacterium]MBT4560035.1 aconitate hydratase [Planctomycetota bacterium]MBT5100455.1 aconitate hydratase [Planctomycetota bacterium]MBT5119189.1 aconitate hydratase [Planctomycetota bacterium]